MMMCGDMEIAYIQKGGVDAPDDEQTLRLLASYGVEKSLRITIAVNNAKK